jgi:hypothetical protein
MGEYYDGAKGPRPLVDYARELDMFPKTLDECQTSSKSGGLVALLTFGFMAALIVSELMHYRGVDRFFQFGVDPSGLAQMLEINIDIDIKSPCNCMSLSEGQAWLILQG